MKTYNIDIAKDTSENWYYILDFTIDRPTIIRESDIDTTVNFARGYKSGIEVNSYNKYSPKIQNIEETNNIKQYIENKKKYYKKLWKSEE